MIGKKFWIIKPITARNEIEYTSIDPEYIIFDKSFPGDDPRHRSTYIARPLLAEELDLIYARGHKSDLPGSERWKSMNYGSLLSSQGSEPYVARLCAEHISQYPVIINEALIDDLRRGLHPDPLPYGAFGADAFIEWLKPATMMQVYGLMFFTATACRQYFWELGYYFPQSYIVAEYVAFARYLRTPFPRAFPTVKPQGKEITWEWWSDSEGDSEDDSESETEARSERESSSLYAKRPIKAKERSWETQFRAFQLERLEFWKARLKLGSVIAYLPLTIENFTTKTMRFEIAYKKMSDQWLNYPLHIADVRVFNTKQTKLAYPTLRFARSLGLKPPVRRLSLAGIIRARCGLLPSDKPAKLPEGSLGFLTAKTICSGPFKLVLTKNPADHLRLVEEGDTMVLQILSPDAILSIFALQHSGLLRFILIFLC